MSSYSFLDDYSEGCHPEILEALMASNIEQQTAYGNDEYTLVARRLIAQSCGLVEVPVFLVAGGTLANLIICSAVLRPHEAVISAVSGHIAARETGAIEATGHKIITVPCTDGKLTAAGIQSAVAANSQAPHMAKPRMVYISNATEFGTVYTLGELRALRSCCDDHGLLLMIDGARLGVALESPRSHDVTMAEIAAVSDIFWIGGTKAGTLFGEAIVVPNPSLADDFEFHIKQRGALLAKGRSMGVQFATLFDQGLFERSSQHANGAARALAESVRKAGYGLAADLESNQVFVILPNAAIATLQESFSFYVWEPLDDDRSVIRLVTSWATDMTQVERFVSVLQELRI